MKKIIFVLILFIITYNASSQAPLNIWKSEEISFKTVNLEIHDAKNKLLYKGLKDCSIDIVLLSNDYPSLTSIKMKLSGYFEMNFGQFYSMDYKIDKEGGKKVTYSFEEGTTIATLLIVYETGKEDPTMIYVAITENVGTTKSKMTVYTLTGFE